MKTINVSDEMYDFLMETAYELNTQSNRHTDTPIFRIYEDTKVEKRDGCGDHLERLDYEGAEEHYCKHCKEILEETDYDFDKLPEIGQDGCDCDCITDAHWTYDEKLLPASGGYDGVAFLTEKAAEEYRQDNKHHFTRGGVVFAESAFRNHELKTIINFIKSLNRPEYTTLETFEIKNRGTAHVVMHSWQTDPRALIDKEVVLDGELVHVNGVETFAIPYRKSDKVEGISILVRKVLDKN